MGIDKDAEILKARAKARAEAASSGTGRSRSTAGFGGFKSLVSPRNQAAIDKYREKDSASKKESAPLVQASPTSKVPQAFVEKPDTNRTQVNVPQKSVEQSVVNRTQKPDTKPTQAPALSGHKSDTADNSEIVNRTQTGHESGTLQRTPIPKPDTQPDTNISVKSDTNRTQSFVKRSPIRPEVDLMHSKPGTIGHKPDTSAISGLEQSDTKPDTISGPEVDLNRTQTGHSKSDTSLSSQRQTGHKDVSDSSAHRLETGHKPDTTFVPQNQIPVSKAGTIQNDPGIRAVSFEQTRLAENLKSVQANNPNFAKSDYVTQSEPIESAGSGEEFNQETGAVADKRPLISPERSKASIPGDSAKTLAGQINVQKSYVTQSSTQPVEAVGQGIKVSELPPLPSFEEASASQGGEVARRSGNESSLDSKRPLPVIPTKDPSKYRTQTGHTPDTNTDTKYDTKPDTVVLKPNTNRTPIGHNTDTQPNTNSDTSRSHQGFKSEPLVSVFALSGYALKFLNFIFDQAQWNKGLITNYITREQVAANTGIPEASIKTTVSRLAEKCLLDRYHFVPGRSGSTSYIIAERTYHEMLQMRANTQAPIGHKSDTKQNTEPDTNPLIQTNKLINNINIEPKGWWYELNHSHLPIGSNGMRPLQAACRERSQLPVDQGGLTQEIVQDWLDRFPQYLAAQNQAKMSTMPFGGIMFNAFKEFLAGSSVVLEYPTQEELQQRLQWADMQLRIQSETARVIEAENARKKAEALQSANERFDSWFETSSDEEKGSLVVKTHFHSPEIYKVALKAAFFLKLGIKEHT